MTHVSPQTVAELAALLADFRAQKAEHETKLAEISRIIDGFETFLAQSDRDPYAEPPETLDASREPVRGPVPRFQAEGGQSSLPLPVPGRSNGRREESRGLTQLEALVLIAKRNDDGIIRVTDAKQRLIDAGLAKGKQRNVATHIYHMLARSDQFEHVAPGTFQLVEPPMRGTPASTPHPPGTGFVTAEDSQEQPQD